MVFATADNEDSNCSRQLVQAIYLQDIGHFFDATAHFDNCTFDGSIDYIESLLGEADDLVKSAHTHRDGGQYRRGGTAVAEAMTRLGQVLHAVQDFYAHSNYVDLMDEWETAYDNIDPIQLWNASGRTKIQGLIRRGLVSGTVAWQPTQNVCPDGTPSHGDLNKDSDDGSPGIGRWKGLNKHGLAFELAMRSSELFLKDAFNRWPLLVEICKRGVIYRVYSDRRVP